MVWTTHLSTQVYHRKPPKNLRYPRRNKLPPDLEFNTFFKKKPSPLLDPATDGDLVVDDAREKHLVVDGFETNDEDDEGVLQNEAVTYHADNSNNNINETKDINRHTRIQRFIEVRSKLTYVLTVDDRGSLIHYYQLLDYKAKISLTSVCLTNPLKNNSI